MPEHPGEPSGPIRSLDAVTFTTADMARACAFYDAAGFVSNYGGPDAEFTSYHAGGGFVNLQLDETWSRPERVWGRAIFFVDDVDAMHRRLRAAGYTPVTEPADAPWGERYFHVHDPDGHEVSFARPLAVPDDAAATPSRSRSEQVLARRFDAGTTRTEPTTLAVEEPLEIRLDDVLVATTMRTPGHDFELAVGFCHTEGLLAGAPVTSCRYCATASALDTAFNVVTVQTGGRAPTPTPRLGIASTSCGLCGSTTIEELCDRLAPLPDGADRPPPEVLVGVPDAVRPLQTLFEGTGAVHAAAAFDQEGHPYLVREDIGRHNALDKVIGALVLEGRRPAPSDGVFLSGRASFEMVQKAWAGGFPTVVSVSAPSALAVRTAERANLSLVGFTRDGRCTRYT